MLTLVAGACRFAGTGCSTLHGVTSPRGAREEATATESAPKGRQPDCDVLRCVALTFDGGPSKPTPRLLDILKQKKVYRP
ncbi:polysaccharide deacetylase family protein [Streptomyces olivaceoviridis]|uniref:polysaccharide deacetylase family protein n=1 Tax=Streptomyces olivaceoviridis TaxID=1921 RepID=UPI0036CBF87F